MRTQLRSRLIYASASTLVGGLTFALLGSIDRFPFGPIGFGVFLVGVFAVAMLLFGKVE